MNTCFRSEKTISAPVSGGAAIAPVSAGLTDVGAVSAVKVLIGGEAWWTLHTDAASQRGK